MAPRDTSISSKNNKNKKKNVVAVSVKARKPVKKQLPNQKKKTTDSPLNHLNVSSIAVLGERRDNMTKIFQKTYDFELDMVIPKILDDKEYEDCDVWISGGSPQASSFDLTQSSTPTLILHLVPNHQRKPPPPFVAYSAKDEFKILPLSQQGLFWTNIAPRVHILKSSARMTKRSIQALEANDDSLAKEEYMHLWTAIPRKHWQTKANGDLDVKFVDFAIPTQGGKGEPIYGSFTKGDGLEHYIDTMVNMYGEEIGGDAAATIKSTVAAAFAAARSKLVEEKEKLEGNGYDAAFLDKIQTIKLYPKGTSKTFAVPYLNKSYLNANKVMIGANKVEIVAQVELPKIWS